MSEPLGETEEGIVYAEVDLGIIGVAKAAYDPVGHYSRPDVLRLLFNGLPMPRMRTFEQVSVAESIDMPPLPSDADSAQE